MASAELSMSVGDVVMVKTEDAAPVGGTKPQVILQLQPITQGMCEDSAETEAAIVAVDGDQGDVAAEGEEVEYGYPITCGDSRAVLLFKKFVCPGINVRCVKYNDQLISPKQFVHLSGKATLKDWKRAIRLGGVMLRKMMDSGQIDFYQHETVCTNTCRSTKFDLLINNTRLPPQGSVMSMASSPQGNESQAAAVEERREEVTAAGVEWSPSVAGASTAAPETETKVEVEEISEETLNFWKGIADVGLIGEVVSNIRTELLALLRGVQQRCGQATLQEPDAAVLHSLAQMFGLLDCVKRAVQKRWSQTDESQEGLRSTLVDLERQLEEQKKQAHDRRPRSQPLPSVLFAPLSSSSKPPAPKRPRLQRPSSTSAISVSARPQPAPQFTVLSPITIDSVGQPFSIAGLPVATLAQLPAGSQVITRYATCPIGTGHVKADAVTLHPSTSLTLLSTTAVADPGPLGAMVSPVELVHLAQEGEELAGDQVDGPGGEEMVEGAVLVRDGAGVEAEDESQTHTTVIEIDPAPSDSGTRVVGLQVDSDDSAIVVQAEMEMVGGAETDGEGGVEVVEEAEGDDEAGVMLQSGIEMVGGVDTDEEGTVVLQSTMEMAGVAETDAEGRLVLQGGIEMVDETEVGVEIVGGAEIESGDDGGARMVVHTEVVELEQPQDQLHNVEIVVMGEEAHTESVAK